MITINIDGKKVFEHLWTPKITSFGVFDTFGHILLAAAQTRDKPWLLPHAVQRWVARCCDTEHGFLGRSVVAPRRLLALSAALSWLAYKWSLGNLHSVPFFVKVKFLFGFLSVSKIPDMNVGFSLKRYKTNFQKGGGHLSRGKLFTGNCLTRCTLL